MSQDKIDKLRELAERGVDGERENARAMLTKAGIDWKKPKESLVDRVKKTVGMNIEKKYSFPIEYPSDIMFLAILKNTRTKSKHQLIISNIRIIITCTPAEIEDINAIYKRHREAFTHKMEKQAKDYYNTLV